MVFVQDKLAQIVAQLSLVHVLASVLPDVKAEPIDYIPHSPHTATSSQLDVTSSNSAGAFPSPPATPVSSLHSSSPDLPTFIKSSPRQSCARDTPARDLHTPTNYTHTHLLDTPANEVTFPTPNREISLSPPFSLSPDSVDQVQTNHRIPFICSVSAVTSLADISDLGSLRNDLNR